jgi:GTPase SAR1 family protein
MLGNHISLRGITYELLAYNASKVIQDFIFKVIVIGNSGVGKSCLINRATKNEFKSDHEVTLGVEFGAMMLKMNQ